MKYGIIVFPGSNCDQDIYHALKNVLKQQVVKLWHKQHHLEGCDFLIVPGGFSYGDYLRSGAIARFSPVMKEVTRHAQHGNPVLGICNGFQILTEAHLLPGVLLPNKNRNFVAKNAWIKPVSTSVSMTKNLEPGPYHIPVAHADGRYFADDDTLKAMQDHDQVLFTYCNEQGYPDEASNFNGSVNHIAGIANKEKNVFALMPHPERAMESWLGNNDGNSILQGLVE